MAKTVYEIIVSLSGDTEARQGIEQIGKAAALSGAALTAFGTATAKMASDYDYNARQVLEVGNEQTGTLEELKQAFFDLSNAMDGAINVNEAAIASYDLASAGIKDQTDLMAALEQSQKTAIAGRAELADVTKVAAQIHNAFGDTLGENLTTAEKFALITDGLIQTQADGITDVAKLSQTYGRVAATAASAGVSFQQVNAILANSTGKGLETSSAVAGLTQVIAGLQKPTAEAVEEAKRLNIEFSATALQNKDLSEILLSIGNSSELAADSVAKLFGSTEAQTVVNQVLVDSGAKLTEALNNQEKATGAAAAGFERLADSPAKKADAAFNKLQNTLVMLGQSALVAVEPAIDALSHLVDVFATWPSWLHKAIGLTTVLGGATLTTAGSLALFVASSKAVSAQLGLTNIKLGLYIAKTKAAVVSTTAAALANKNLAISITTVKGSLVALSPAVAILGSIAVAAAAATVAFKHFQNAQAEIKFDNLRAAQVETEALARKAVSLGIKIRESGEAIPDAEFDKWIALLNEANEGNDQLTGVIESLQRVQEAAKNKTVEATEATQNQTQANEESAESVEDLATEFENFIDKVDRYVSQSQQRLGIEIDLIKTLGLTEEQQINKRAQLQEQYYQDILHQQENLLKQTQLTEEQRTEALIKAERTRADIELVRFDQNEQLNRLKEQQQEEANRAAQEREEQLQAAEQDRLEAIRRQEQALKEEREEQIRINRERFQAAIDGLQNEIDFTQELLTLNKSYSQLTLDNLATTRNYASGVSSLLGDISTELTDENTSLEQKNLYLDVANQLTGNLKSLGLGINSNLQSEKDLVDAIAQTKILELEIEKEQLKVAKDIILLEAEAQQAQLQGNIDIAASQLSQAEGDEVNRLAKDIELNQKKLEILNKQTEAKLKANELDLTRVTAQTAIEQIRQLPVRPEVAAEPVRNAFGHFVDPSQANRERNAFGHFVDSGPGSSGSENVADLFEKQREIAEQTKEIQAQDVDLSTARNESLNAANESNSSALTSLQSISSGQEIQTNAIGVIQMQQASVALIASQQLQSLAGIQNNTSKISAQMDGIKSEILSLPRKIAASMPKPTPPPSRS